MPTPEPTQPQNRAITYRECAACRAEVILPLDFDEETTECPACYAINWRNPEDTLNDEWEASL